LEFHFERPTILSICYVARNSEHGEEAARQLRSEGLAPEQLQLDVDHVDSINAAKEEVRKSFGRLDVLVNNAAVMLKVRGSVGKVALGWKAKVSYV